MQILLVTPLLPPDIGGPATYSALLLRELPKRAVSVQKAYFGDVRHLPVGIRHLVFFFKILSRSRGTSVILALDPVSVGFPAALAAALTRKPFVLKIVGDYAWEQSMQRFGVTDLLDEFVKKRDYPLRVRFLRSIQVFVARRAARVVVPSNYLKTIVAQWGIAAEKITVIHNGVETPALPTKEELRKILEIDDKLLISVGRLVPWKGFPALIRVFGTLSTQFPKAKLMLVGSGPDEKYLKFLIRERNLVDRVIMPGRMPREMLLRYLKAADVFVLNTGYEGLSHQVLEVMSVGTPIVTTPAGGNAEVITDGENGVLVPYNDEEKITESLVKMLSDTNLRERIVHHGTATVLQFTDEAAVEGMASVLHSCAS